MIDFELIQKQKQLNRCVAELSKASYLAIDTEFRREHSYFAELALIQIASDTAIACIDPLADLDLSELSDLLSNDIPTYLHAGYQDAEICMQSLNCQLGNVLDTQIAAAFCNYQAQISYQNIVENCLGIQLDKSASRSDWMRRPLTAHQLNYAKADVLHLGDVAEVLKHQLSEKNHLNWAWEESARLVQEACTPPSAEAAWERIKVRNDVTADAQRYLIALHQWREQQAIDLDKPRNWIAHDNTLLAIATSDTVITVDEIATLLQQDRRADIALAVPIKEIMQHVSSSANLDSDNNSAKTLQLIDSSPKETLLLKSVMKYVHWKANQLNLPASLLASKKMVTALVREQPTPLASGWRLAVIGETLQAIIADEKQLSFSKNGEPTLS
jgi:ribonuclease D